MISIITCVATLDKYNSILLPSLHKATKLLWSLGLPALDTVVVYSNEYKNIAEAYNSGKLKSKFAIKAFIHDDMDMMDPSWVLKLMSAFSCNPKCGLIGLVGTEKVDHHNQWWSAGEKFIYGKQYYRQEKKMIGFKKVDQVKYGLECIDGCFMATNRNIYFDSNLETDMFFIAYEHDTSMQIRNQGLDIGVIDHMTWHVCNLGNPNRDVKKLFKSYQKKWGIN